MCRAVLSVLDREIVTIPLHFVLSSHRSIFSICLLIISALHLQCYVKEINLILQSNCYKTYNILFLYSSSNSHRLHNRRDTLSETHLYANAICRAWIRRTRGPRQGRLLGFSRLIPDPPEMILSCAQLTNNWLPFKFNFHNSFSRTNT